MQKSQEINLLSYTKHFLYNTHRGFALERNYNGKFNRASHAIKRNVNRSKKLNDSWLARDRESGSCEIERTFKTEQTETSIVREKSLLLKTEYDAFHKARCDTSFKVDKFRGQFTSTSKCYFGKRRNNDKSKLMQNIKEQLYDEKESIRLKKELEGNKMQLEFFRT